MRPIGHGAPVSGGPDGVQIENHALQPMQAGVASDGEWREQADIARADDVGQAGDAEIRHLAEGAGNIFRHDRDRARFAEKKRQVAEGWYHQPDGATESKIAQGMVEGAMLAGALDQDLVPLA